MACGCILFIQAYSHAFRRTDSVLFPPRAIYAPSNRLGQIVTQLLGIASLSYITPCLQGKGVKRCDQDQKCDVTHRTEKVSSRSLVSYLVFSSLCNVPEMALSQIFCVAAIFLRFWPFHFLAQKSPQTSLEFRGGETGDQHGTDLSPSESNNKCLFRGTAFCAGVRQSHGGGGFNAGTRRVALRGDSSSSSSPSEISLTTAACSEALRSSVAVAYSGPFIGPQCTVLCFKTITMTFPLRVVLQQLKLAARFLS